MIELIAGTTPDSKHARMVAAGKGGLNHICFEVEDMFGNAQTTSRAAQTVTVG